jgi:thiol-disulfide isomerase/thioredoxin
MEQTDSSVRWQEWDESLAVLQECLEFNLMSCSFVNLLEFRMLPFMLLTKVSFLHLPSCGVGNFLSHLIVIQCLYVLQRSMSRYWVSNWCKHCRMLL